MIVVDSDATSEEWGETPEPLSSTGPNVQYFGGGKQNAAYNIVVDPWHGIHGRIHLREVPSAPLSDFCRETPQVGVADSGVGHSLHRKEIFGRGAQI